MPKDGFKIDGKQVIFKYKRVGQMVHLAVEQRILPQLLEFILQQEQQQQDNQQATAFQSKEDPELEQRKEYLNARKNIINYAMQRFHKYSKQNKSKFAFRYLNKCKQHRRSDRFIAKDLITLYENDYNQDIKRLWTDFLNENLWHIIKDDNTLRRGKQLYQSFIADLLEETEKEEPYKGFYSGYHYKNRPVSYGLSQVERSTQEEQPYDYFEASSQPQFWQRKKTRYNE